MRFLQDEIIVINVAEKTVRTKAYVLQYDYLIVAMGAELAPELIPGLAEGAYNLCNLESVMQLKHAVAAIAEGTVAIMISSTPFKCPPAPYEYAFLIDEILRKREVREKVKMVLATPEPQPMPIAGRLVGDSVKAMLAGKNIGYHPEHKPKNIDIVKKIVEFENGHKLHYDILAAMPPHRVPQVLRDAGLADASGFIPVDMQGFSSPVAHVYAVGDVASIRLPSGKPHPKAGVFAEAQAVAAAGNIIADIEGKEQARYAGKGTCFVEVGDAKAALVESDLLADGGPKIVMMQPSGQGLEGKRLFEEERLGKWFRD